jgi:RAD51-like protein 3
MRQTPPSLPLNAVKALALQVLCRHLHDTRKGNALWIDTTGDFSASRATNDLQSWNIEVGLKISYYCQIDPFQIQPILERLQVVLAFDIDSVYDVLDSISVRAYTAYTTPPSFI